MGGNSKMMGRKLWGDVGGNRLKLKLKKGELRYAKYSPIFSWGMRVGGWGLVFAILKKNGIPGDCRAESEKKRNSPTPN